MGVYYLKNSTGSSKEVADLGLVIADGQSITIDENDFDGYLTDDMITQLNDDPGTGLVLSTTDIGDSSGDFTKAVSIERLTLKTKWKPSVADFSSLPTTGNEDGDIRLVRDSSILYRWTQSQTQWDQITSTLTVAEYDEDPSASGISKLVFVEAEDDVYIDGNIAYIGPPEQPGSLASQALVVAGTSFVTGGLSQSNVNYKGVDPAGDVVAYITDDVVFSLTTPDTGSRCNYGDRGTLVVYLNGTAIATADLAANFEEGNRETDQVMTNYDNAGTGDPMTNGVVDFVGAAAGKGNLTVLSVGQYNNFKYYQKWTAQINITDSTLLRQGYNEIYLAHEGLASYGGNQSSSILDVFYDTDTGADPSVSTPTVTENTPSFNYLSGVKAYGSGSTFDIDVTGSDCFDNVYHSSGAPIVLSGWPGLSSTGIAYNDGSVSGVSSPPDIGETMSVSNWLLTQGANQVSENARLTATPRDPYGSYVGVQSASDNIYVNSYGNVSTDLIEYFRDEDYRLTDGAYDAIPGAITGQWDSTGNLDTYDDGNGLQVFIDKLVFPTIDFSTRQPTGNPNYSGLGSETNKTYFRAFRDTVASHANGTLRMTGITKTQLYNRDIRVWIKAPTQTGWLDLTRDYNFATFSGSDEDGCWVERDSQTNSDFQFTIGQNYTENSGDMIIVKVQYPGNSAPEITHLEIIDW